MKRHTAAVYSAMLLAMAEAYEVSEQQIREQFAATEPMAQSLNDAIQDSSELLKQISVFGVDDPTGEVLTMAIASSLAKRTDVSAGDRQPTLAGTPTDRKYATKLTEFDVGIAYALLDVWARYPDFQQRYMNAVYRRIALDRIMIGFYGESAAAVTDRDTYPNLTDVNIGWLKDLETNMSEHFITEGTVADTISIGSTGDYKNIDHLVSDVKSIIPKMYRTGSEVAIVGEGLVTYDMNKTYQVHGEDPLQKAHIKLLGKSYGGIPAVTVPHFPDNGCMVTDLKNLHLYWQRSGVRRQNENQPARNRVVDYISSNDAYMIGELNGCAAIKAANVSFV